MKALTYLLVLFLITCRAAAQPSKPEEKLIFDFLNYVKSPHWNVDTVDSKFIVDYPKDTPAGTRELRQKYLGLQVKFLQNHLNTVSLDSLRVIPYLEAPEKFRKLTLGEEFSSRSFVVTDSKNFIRYILTKGNKIQAFDLWQKAYWLFD